MNFVARAGTNLPRMGDFNSLVVLEQVRRSRAGVSRVEIAANSGLSAQTVSNQVTKLMESGLIVEGERVPQLRGKPRTLLNLNPQAGYVVGVHVDPVLVSFVLTDVSVTILERSSFPMPATVGDLCRLIGAETARLLEGLPADKVLGLGLAVPGPVDSESGTVVYPPNLKGWGRVHLRDLVEEATGLPTFIQKDSIAALTGELWFRNRSLLGSTLFVYLGFGLGFAFAYRGELNHGFAGNAGEVGHFRVSNDTAECSCGHSGCLGTAVSPATIVRQAIEEGLVQGEVDVTDPRAISEPLAQVVKLAAEGNVQAVEILDDTSSQLAQGILAMVDFIDASDVVVGGHAWKVFEPYLEEKFQEEYGRLGASRLLHSVEFHAADFGEWGVAAGAACLVLDNTFSPRSSMLSTPGERPTPALPEPS